MNWWRERRSILCRARIFSATARSHLCVRPRAGPKAPPAGRKGSVMRSKIRINEKKRNILTAKHMYVPRRLTSVCRRHNKYLGGFCSRKNTRRPQATTPRPNYERVAESARKLPPQPSAHHNLKAHKRRHATLNICKAAMPAASGITAGGGSAVPMP